MGALSRDYSKCLESLPQVLTRQSAQVVWSKGTLGRFLFKTVACRILHHTFQSYCHVSSTVSWKFRNIALEHSDMIEICDEMVYLWLSLVVRVWKLAYCKQSNTERYIHAKAKKHAAQVTKAIFIAQISVFIAQVSVFIAQISVFIANH